MTEKRTHTSDCDWHVDQYPWECTCGFIPRKKAMDNLIAQDADLIDKLRDEDSYYRLQEKHWCIDAEELERQRLAAADRIEALEAALRIIVRETTAVSPDVLNQQMCIDAVNRHAIAALGDGL